MKSKSQKMTSQRAWELSRWCTETAETIRDHNSNPAARVWWETECDKPSELAVSPRPTEHMIDFADRLEAEGYEWAGAAGELAAEEDGFGVASR